nr:replication protein A 70 kDa DNA-binding subunit D-like [Ipomoea batatas]
MAPMYILVEELDKDRTSVAIRLRAVRTYNVWHSRGRDQIKSRECVFHDEVILPQFLCELSVAAITELISTGEVKICSSYDATKLLFNENSLEFVEFINSLSMQQQTPLKSITSNSTFSYGTTSGVESSSKMKITTLSDIFSKREADELKAMQPSVMTKVPKDIRNLKGKGLFFKISVKSETFDKLENAVPVLQVKHFPEMFETYCPGLIQHNDDEFSSKLQLTHDDSDSDEDEACNETEAVKRSLLDEFSSTQPSKKKKDVVVKMEDEKEQENENSMQDENVIGPKHNRLSSIQTPNKLFGVFQSSLVTPLSVLTEGPSRLSNDLTYRNRTPLQDISLTVNMNQERENENSMQHENVICSKHNRLSSIETPKQLFGVFESSLVTPSSVLTEGPSTLSNDLIDKTRAPLQDIPATLNMNRERDSSFQSTSSTITNAMMSSTMEFRNLNNDFEEAMEEQDLTNNESIG